MFAIRHLKVLGLFFRLSKKYARISSIEVSEVLKEVAMGVGSNVMALSCKRKEARRKKKKLKKMQRSAFHSHKKVEQVVAERLEINMKDGSRKSKKRKAKRGSKRDTRLGEHSEDAPLKKRRNASAAEGRRKQELKRSIIEDEMEIKRLAKKLGYNKRKSKNLPQVFAAEGLDYILEICDSSKRCEDAENKEEEDEDVVKSEDEDTDVRASGHGLSEDYDLEQRGNKCLVYGGVDFSSNINKRAEQRQVKFDEDPSTEAEENFEGNAEEDIYGRLVDKMTGKVLTRSVGAQEKLNELESRSGAAESEQKVKVLRSFTGIVNRLSEQTIVSAVKSVKELFASYGHNDVKQSLFEALYKSVSVGYRLPDRMVIEYGLFVALVHATLSDEISSHFVEHFILQFVSALKSWPDNKMLENISVLLAQLYNFKIIKVVIVLEILELLMATSTAKALECSKLILMHCGSIMKKRDAGSLQKYITEAQAHLAKFLKEKDSDQHFRFVVEEFMEIRNANIRKWTDAVDISLFKHYMSIFHGLTKGMDKEKELGMSVDDIVHIPKRGRWWLVGSAWLPSSGSDVKPSSLSRAGDLPKFDQSLLNVAKKAKMNTAVRRDVFCTLMSSKDETDAFEKLMKLSLKGQQEREIIHICVYCTLRESLYNPFYAAVIELFCSFHKRFKLTVQYALWDRLKDLADLRVWQRSNLAALIADLILKRSVGLTVLKVIEFGSIDITVTRFLRRLLTTVLTKSNESNLAEIFSTVVSSPTQKLFSQGLQVFIHMALRKPRKSADSATLLARIDFLDSIWGDDRL